MVGAASRDSSALAGRRPPKFREDAPKSKGTLDGLCIHYSTLRTNVKTIGKEERVPRM
jgi:hypothetical protein